MQAALTVATPRCTGVTFVDVMFTDAARRHPHTASRVGDGHVWADGDGKTLALQRDSGDVVRGRVSLRDRFSDCCPELLR